jgi:hypothetical protein
MNGISDKILTVALKVALAVTAGEGSGLTQRRKDAKGIYHVMP